MITNCDVPLTIAQLITIIVPVASSDVLNTPNKQWQTRMLYNAYLPFNYSYILDTHVFPCYNDSYSKVFSLFSESGVDVSASSRDGDRVYVSGGAVLSKWGAPSHSFWKEVYQRMLVCNGCDDQSAIQYVIERNQTHQWTYRWLSSNWFWASIGITEEGFFLGSARCYRSSVIATGPIMWIHGDPGECGLPCNWSFPGEKPFSGLLKNSSEIWNVTEKLGEPLSLFVHSQTLPTVFSCYNLLGLIVIEMSIFVRNACRTNSSPRFWSFH